MNSQSGFFQAHDGLPLYYLARLAATSRPAIVFVHGVGEHIGRYDSVFEWFCDRGYSCFGCDHRGFGQSGGRRGHVVDFERYGDDLRTFISDIVAPATENDIVLFGHSMGSIVALSAALHDCPALAGLLIFSCPLVMAQWSSKIGGVIANSVHTLAPKLMVPNLIDPAALTNDPDMIRAFENDPNNFGSVSLGWLNEFSQACCYIEQHAGEIHSPVLIAHGSADRIADLSGAQWLFDHVSSPDKTLEIFSGFKHELLNHLPPDRERVLLCAFAWLETRFDMAAGQGVALNLDAPVPG